MTGAVKDPAPSSDEDFIMPVATETTMDDLNDDLMDDFEDDPDLNINADFGADFGDDLGTDFGDDHSTDLAEDFNDADDIIDDDFEDGDEVDDFAPLYEPEETASPKHEVTVDISPIGGDDFDMPVGSFGGGGTSDDDASETGGLSPSAQQKLAELNERGTT